MSTAAPHEEKALQGLRVRLLSDRPPALRPEHGHLAFMSHVLLASVVHNATRLDQYGAESQTGAWVRYLTSYFPPGKNSEPDARLLWTDWRTALLKKQAPGPGVLVTHGQSAVIGAGTNRPGCASISKTYGPISSGRSGRSSNTCA